VLRGETARETVLNPRARLSCKTATFIAQSSPMSRGGAQPPSATSTTRVVDAPSLIFIITNLLLLPV
jgi:hypothetical protein